MDEDVGFPTMLLRLICMAVLVALFVIVTALLNEYASAGPIVPLIALAAFGYTYVRTDWSFLGLSSRGWRRFFGFLTGLTAIGSVMGINALADRREAAEARRIVALRTSDPAGQSVLLAAADKEMLGRIEEIAPDIAAQEARRRAAVAIENRRKIDEANKQTELANKSKIDTILAQVAQLSDEDIDKQIDAYARLVTLAPGRADYRKKLEEWNAEHAYRADVERNPMKGVKLVHYEWSTGSGSARIVADIKVKNVSNVVLKDFDFRCLQYAQSGSQLRSPSDFDRVKSYSAASGKITPNYRNSTQD